MPTDADPLRPFLDATVILQAATAVAQAPDVESMVSCLLSSLDSWAPGAALACFDRPAGTATPWQLSPELATRGLGPGALEKLPALLEAQLAEAEDEAPQLWIGDDPEDPEIPSALWLLSWRWRDQLEGCLVLGDDARFAVNLSSAVAQITQPLWAALGRRRQLPGDEVKTRLLASGVPLVNLEGLKLLGESLFATPATWRQALNLASQEEQPQEAPNSAELDELRARHESTEADLAILRRALDEAQLHLEHEAELRSHAEAQAHRTHKPSDALEHHLDLMAQLLEDEAERRSHAEAAALRRS